MSRGMRLQCQSSPQIPFRVLSTMTVQIDGMRHTALVDTGCMQTLIHEACCQVWERKEVHVLTVGGSTLLCWGVGLVWLSMNNRSFIDIEVLIIDEELLGFDLLLWLDIIKHLGGMFMTSSGEVKFSLHDEPICAASMKLPLHTLTMHSLMITYVLHPV